MPREHQSTLARRFGRAGRGLHTGQRVDVQVSPACADHGIVFRRVLKGGRTAEVPASWRFRESQPLCTALRSPDGTLVRTVEHLLAALAAFGVDNALVEIDAEELPIFDGSALPWCEAIREAGRTGLDERRRVLRVRRPVCVQRGKRLIRIEPGQGLQISGSVALAYFGPLTWSGLITPERFCAEIAPARSFGRYRRAMLGRAYGFLAGKPLLQGCGPRSAAMLVRGRAIGGLRFVDEPVRHRVLDVIGDLALAGFPIEGRVTALHTGHELNHALVAELMTDPTAWELV